MKNCRSKSKYALAHAFMRGLPMGHIWQGNACDVEIHHHQQTKVGNLSELLRRQLVDSFKKLFDMFTLIWAVFDFLCRLHNWNQWNESQCNIHIIYLLIFNKTWIIKRKATWVSFSNQRQLCLFLQQLASGDRLPV